MGFNEELDPELAFSPDFNVVRSRKYQEDQEDVRAILEALEVGSFEEYGEFMKRIDEED